MWHHSLRTRRRGAARAEGTTRRSLLGRGVSRTETLKTGLMEYHYKTSYRSGSSGMMRHWFAGVLPRGGVAQRATKLCYAWIWLWLVVGNTPSGKQLYQKLAGFLVEDTKGGLPLVTLALPILGSAVVATILHGRHSHPAVGGASKGGDPSFDVYAFWMLLVPLACYALSSICGRWNSPSAFDEKLSGTANTFGLTALVALSLGLVPVARHSVLLRSMGWNPAAAIRLHVWSGRIVVVGSFLHGGLHVWRFLLLKYNLYEVLVPPVECRVWYRSEVVEIPGCSGEDCSCYSWWRNLTGAVAVAGLLVVGLSTLNFVRRRWYAAFYRIHVVAGPLVLLAVLLHWSRSMLYLSAGLVYYLASSVALWLEHQHADDHPVEIVDVRHLPTSDPHGRPCVSLTVAATDSAIAQFQAGQYVRLHVPSLTSVAHPFTINRVLQSEDGGGTSDGPPRLRLVFRVQGPFTRQLADQLLRRPSHRPPVFLDAYHGVGRLPHALRHDWVMVVAGGIGITPYLSLLVDLLRATAAAAPSHDGDGPKLRTVVVHWVCRDRSLVDYVQAEYLDPLVTAAPAPGSCTLRICIHHTGDRSTLSPSPESVTEGAAEHSATDVKESPYRPFEPSHRGIPPFVGTVVASLAALWPLYVVARSHPASVLPRLLAPLAALLVVVVAWGIAARRKSRDCEPATNISRPWKRWRRYQSLSSSDDESLEGRLELRGVAAGAPGPVDGSLVRGGGEPRVPAVRLEHREGRPSLRGLLAEALLPSLSEASSVGLFVCGPSALGRGLRQALGEGRRHPPVAVYEESFEL